MQLNFGSTTSDRTTTFFYGTGYLNRNDSFFLLLGYKLYLIKLKIRFE